MVNHKVNVSHTKLVFALDFKKAFKGFLKDLQEIRYIFSILILLLLIPMERYFF